VLKNFAHLCIGEPLVPEGWSGLPLGRFAPPGHDAPLPVAAYQDTLFVWRDGASPARVRAGGETLHYERHSGVLDVMAVDEEVYVSHDRPEHPGECLLVAFPEDLRRELGYEATHGRAWRVSSRFGFADDLQLELALALEYQCLRGEPLGRLFTESVSIAFVNRVMERQGRIVSDASAKTQKKLGHRQCARLIRFVDEHLARNITIEDLAQVAGLTPERLVRTFRNTFGLAPYQFVIRRRVERARSLLKSSDMSLVEIGAACGFSDQPHFTSVFNRIAGMPPGRYRLLART
jgi:AraC family transcriptional regulator